MKKKKIYNLISRVMKDYITGKVFVFGSQANRNELSHSDIDVGFECEKEVPFRTYLKIKNALEELPILHKIDLVDFSKVNLQFKENAYQNIELI